LSTTKVRRGRRLVPAIVALGMMATAFTLAQPWSASAAERADIVSRFDFEQMPIKLPPGLPTKDIRQVNPAYKQIQAWISSVGAAMAVNDIAGTGKAADLCLVDPRSDRVIVTPAPGTGDRYAPFALDPAPLSWDSAMAPSGCVPGDYNGDGRMDLLTYNLGRTPILYLARPDAKTLSANAFTPTELVPTTPSPTGRYTGPRWQSTAAAVEDFDGDGHPDIIINNYFPDSDVFDPNGQDNVTMNDSMSRAINGGGAHVFRWFGQTPTSVTYDEQKNAIPYQYATGWTLGAAGADLDGDSLPELYLANDFGQDRLFHNISHPGMICFALVEGSRGPTDPKSMVVGHDSFKGMSIDFADMRNTGKLDAFVSNITVSWGIEESNLVWINNSKDDADARAKLNAGEAFFDNEAFKKGLAFTGWGWDAKFGDFDNSGNLAIVQADGFVKGDINRWNWLQELAIENDQLVHDPKMWPKAEKGDDIAGDEHLAFFAPTADGSKYVNISDDLGIGSPNLTRGIAIGDTTGTGFQDLAISRQWNDPVFFKNKHPQQNNFVGLRLYRPVDGVTPGQQTGLQNIGSPAYGATVKITTADGKVHLDRLDGGSGHAGKRSFDIFQGLGSSSAPVKAELCWRDLNGQVHMQDLSLSPGWHDFVLDGSAQEVSAK
jgi:enediyne biosynthesis protein E4